jgi:hypothetical protein
LKERWTDRLELFLIPVVRGVVGTDASADNKVIHESRPPREPETRSKVVEIGIDDLRAHTLTCQDDTALLGIKVEALVLDFTGLSRVLISEAEVQCEVWRELPVVLNVSAQVLATHVLHRIADRSARLTGDAQKEVRNSESLDPAVPAIEIKARISGKVRYLEIVDLAHLNAGAHIVLSENKAQIVSELEVLIQRANGL